MGIWAVLSDRTIRFPLIVGIALQVAQQFSGINRRHVLSNLFFQNVGLKDPLVGTTLVGTINVISTGVALVLMDTAGRRPLPHLLVHRHDRVVARAHGSRCLSCCRSTAMVSVGGVMCFVWFFEIGLGPIPWLIVAEMLPAKPRPTAMSIATMVNWMCSFIVGLVFPSMQASLNEYSFVPFAVCLAFCAGVHAEVRPETKGKTITEIQAEMR
ncbi:hypothetical protein PINS_up020935 [Pythium insidiosum]|nr:hypothetical protein PINS_up020935 [Pythium insidiosum]